MDKQSSTSCELGLTPLWVEALMTNEAAMGKINKLYKENKYEAYKLASNNEFYNFTLFTDGNIEREINVKRVFGIILLADRECKKGNFELYNEILEAIKLGWPLIFNHASNNTKINFDKCIQDIDLKHDSDDKINGACITIIMLGLLMDKEVVPHKRAIDAQSLLRLKLEHYVLGNNRFFCDNIKKDKELIKKANNILDRIYENYGKIESLEDLTGFKNQKISLFADSLSMIFDTEDMMLSSMFDKPLLINEEDLIELAALYYIQNKNQNADKAFEFIIFGLILKFTIKSYKELKEYYFANNKETMYVEIKGYKEKIKKQNADIKKMQNTINQKDAEIERLREEYKKTLEKENILLNKKITEL